MSVEANCVSSSRANNLSTSWWPWVRGPRLLAALRSQDGELVDRYDELFDRFATLDLQTGAGAVKVVTERRFDELAGRFTSAFRCDQAAVKNTWRALDYLDKGQVTRIPFVLGMVALDPVCPHRRERLFANLDRTCAATLNRLQQIFRYFDIGRKGYLDHNDLSSLLRTMERLSKTPVEAARIDYYEHEQVVDYTAMMSLDNPPAKDVLRQEIVLPLRSGDSTSSGYTSGSVVSDSGAVPDFFSETETEESASAAFVTDNSDMNVCEDDEAEAQAELIDFFRRSPSVITPLRNRSHEQKRFVTAADPGHVAPDSFLLAAESISLPSSNEVLLGTLSTESVDLEPTPIKPLQPAEEAIRASQSTSQIRRKLRRLFFRRCERHGVVFSGLFGADEARDFTFKEFYILIQSGRLEGTSLLFRLDQSIARLMPQVLDGHLPTPPMSSESFEETFVSHMASPDIKASDTVFQRLSGTISDGVETIKRSMRSSPIQQVDIEARLDKEPPLRFINEKVRTEDAVCRVLIASELTAPMFGSPTVEDVVPLSHVRTPFMPVVVRSQGDCVEPMYDLVPTIASAGSTPIRGGKDVLGSTAGSMTPFGLMLNTPYEKGATREQSVPEPMIPVIFGRQMRSLGDDVENIIGSLQDSPEHRSEPPPRCREDSSEAFAEVTFLSSPGLRFMLAEEAVQRDEPIDVDAAKAEVCRVYTNIEGPLGGTLGPAGVANGLVFGLVDSLKRGGDIDHPALGVALEYLRGVRASEGSVPHARGSGISVEPRVKFSSVNEVLGLARLVQSEVSRGGGGRVLVFRAEAEPGDSDEEVMRGLLMLVATKILVRDGVHILRDASVFAMLSRLLLGGGESCKRSDRNSKLYQTLMRLWVALPPGVFFSNGLDDDPSVLVMPSRPATFPSECESGGGDSMRESAPVGLASIRLASRKSTPDGVFAKELLRPLGNNWKVHNTHSNDEGTVRKIQRRVMALGRRQERRRIMVAVGDQSETLWSH